MDVNQQRTPFDRIISRIKDNPIRTSIVGIGTVIIALSSFTDAAKKLWEEFDRIVPKASDLIFLGTNNQPLAGQDVKAELVNESGKGMYFTFSVIEKNAGISSHPIFLKVYTSDPLTLYAISTDESGFQYEDVPTMNPKEIPPNVSLEYRYSIKLNTQVLPPPGRYTALVKAYYEDEKTEPAKAKFTLDFTGAK
jgi:hypothetical protein